MFFTEIENYLEANTTLQAGTDLFFNRMVDGPTETAPTVAIFEYASGEPDHVMGPNAGSAVSEDILIQVLVRAADVMTARNLARQIWGLLDHFSGDLSGTNYRYITALQSPFYLKMDEDEQVYYACNYRITKAQS